MRHLAGTARKDQGYPLDGELHPTSEAAVSRVAIRQALIEQEFLRVVARNE